MNDVWAIKVNGASRVARRSKRSTPDLDWELDLLALLRASGLTTPEVVATVDGARRHHNLIVMKTVEGRPAETDADYARVADHLRQLHELTSEWPAQRPGWRRCLELVEHEVSGDVDIRELPREV